MVRKTQKSATWIRTPVNLNLDELPGLLIPNSLTSKPHPDYLSKIRQLEHELSQIQSEKNELATEKETLQNDLTELSEQNANLRQKKNQTKQELATVKETINQLTQELTDEQNKRLTAENNLTQEREISADQKQTINDLSQQLQTERETNANLKQELHASEQNYTNLQTAYQKALNDKEITQKQLNQLTGEIKTFAKMLHQWQKLNFYQQLEQQNELQAQIIQPPPWKPNK